MPPSLDASRRAPVIEVADARERILRAAATLLANSGCESVSTRAVCSAAGVGAPTLYHHFGDKQGLLEAVVTHGFEQYLGGKRGLAPTGDPVADLRRGWDLHVEFGCRYPAFYTVMYGTSRPGRRPAAAEEAYRVLVALLDDVARAGRLRVPPTVAARVVHAAGMGVTLTLITDPGGDHDPELSSRTREAVIAAVTTPETVDVSASLPSQAIALRATLGQQASSVLSPAEDALLCDWLHRLASARPSRLPADGCPAITTEPHRVGGPVGPWTSPARRPLGAILRPTWRVGVVSTIAPVGLFWCHRPGTCGIISLLAC